MDIAGKQGIGSILPFCCRAVEFAAFAGQITICTFPLHLKRLCICKILKDLLQLLRFVLEYVYVDLFPDYSSMHPKRSYL
jgi:hypothetical protein